MKKWHKIGFAVAIVLALVSWVLAIYYWSKLPSPIPTHFGWDGQPDAWSPKTIYYVFMIPVLQTVMLGSFGFLYWKPQYSDMPTTLWLMTMESHKRDHAFELIRTMLVGTGIWVGILFTYMTYGMNVSAMQAGLGLNPWLLTSIVGLMIAWLIWWTVKVYRATRVAIKKEA